MNLDVLIQYHTNREKYNVRLCSLADFAAKCGEIHLIAAPYNNFLEALGQ